MVKLDDAAREGMQQRLVHRTYKKKQLFIAEGKVCREIAFITTGSFRYYQMVDGIEVTKPWLHTNQCRNQLLLQL